MNLSLILVASNLFINTLWLSEYISPGFAIAPFKYVIYAYNIVTMGIAFIFKPKRINKFQVYIICVTLLALEIVPYITDYYLLHAYRGETKVGGWISKNTKDKHVPFINTPNYVDRNIRINSKGFRGGEYDQADIIFIGDSVTFGSGGKEKDTFVSIVGNELNVMCANWSVSGYDLLDCVGILHHANYISYRPKLIVYSYCLNDCSATPRIYDEYVGLIANTRKYALHNFIAKALKGGTKKYLTKVLLEIIEECKANGIEFIINILPYNIADLKKPDVRVLNYLFIKEFVIRYKIRHIDALYEFDASCYPPGDPMHLNEKGHRKMAEILADYL